jgi:predicted metal-dependent hydrolase
MNNLIKNLSQFSINEGVNEDLAKAKADVNAKLSEISAESALEKKATEISAKSASIKKQAALYGQLPALLNKLASAMEAKAKSGDTTNIY